MQAVVSSVVFVRNGVFVVLGVRKVSSAWI